MIWRCSRKEAVLVVGTAFGAFFLGRCVMAEAGPVVLQQAAKVVDVGW